MALLASRVMSSTNSPWRSSTSDARRSCAERFHLPRSSDAMSKRRATKRRLVNSSEILYNGGTSGFTWKGWAGSMSSSTRAPSSPSATECVASAGHATSMQAWTTAPTVMPQSCTHSIGGGAGGSGTLGSLTTSLGTFPFCPLLSFASFFGADPSSASNRERQASSRKRERAAKRPHAPHNKMDRSRRRQVASLPRELCCASVHGGFRPPLDPFLFANLLLVASCARTEHRTVSHL